MATKQKSAIKSKASGKPAEKASAKPAAPKWPAKLQQVAAVALKAGDGKNKWSNPENIARFLQSLAVLGAAAWALFVFLRYEAREHSQNIAKADLEIDQLGETRIQPLQKLVIADLGTYGEDGNHLFNVTYSLGIRNNGPKTAEVTYSATEVYVGEMAIGTARGAVEVNRFDTVGPIKWAHVFDRAYYIHPKWNNGRRLTLHGESIAPQDGGGPTGRINQGQWTEVDIEYLVVGKLADRVALRTQFGIDDGKKGSDRWDVSMASGLYESQRKGDGDTGLTASSLRPSQRKDEVAVVVQ